MTAWTPPYLHWDALGTYLVNSTSWQKGWDENEVGTDWDLNTDANYVDTYKKIYDSLVGKFGATEK